MPLIDRGLSDGRQERTQQDWSAEGTDKRLSDGRQERTQQDWTADD